MIRCAAVGFAALSLVLVAGCGTGDHGTATVWVTRDRGAHLVLVREVPAGLTAMQALARVAKIETRYAGRYVQAIDGVSGSLTAHRDWFYFINGYESDRGAAEYRLHDGDVEWWDYRNWQHAMSVPVVVGAFPEPFLHGFDGKRLPAAVKYDAGLKPIARRLAHVVHARTIVPSSGRVGAAMNVLWLRSAPVSSARASGTHPGGAVVFVVAGRLVHKLAADPTTLRYHYEVSP